MTSNVIIRPSGRKFTVEQDESILIAALRQGVQLPHSCRGGSCRSCLARIINGEFSYLHGPPIGLLPADGPAGRVLLCQAKTSVDLEIEVRELDPGPGISTHRLPCRVQRMKQLAPDVMALFLKLPSVEPFLFRAGQYVDFLLRDGKRRSFSIASPPHDADPLEIHVRQVPDGRFSGWVFGECQEKALLRLEGPLGGFFLDEKVAHPIIFVAGGTGFAPIKGMLRHVFQAGLKRPMHLFWGARQEIDLYEDGLIREWVRVRPTLRYTPVLSEAAGQDNWAGAKGWVHQAVLETYPDLSGHQVYLSGPPQMIDAARADFAAHGLPEDQLHFDSFEYALD
ncbi:MAG: CDP-6-deoxy-delta-3,4-glucoseen reductase [Gammaproteobacteria bacterium]|nr:CDP-6-deoxy-delta-3,4-glucoseen reductase [Gammaproteobacteria bacterium]